MTRLKPGDCPILLLTASEEHHRRPQKGTEKDRRGQKRTQEYTTQGHRRVGIAGHRKAQGEATGGDRKLQQAIREPVEPGGAPGNAAGHSQ